MTELEQLAWCGGFFDGEGSVGISRQLRKYGKAKTSVSMSYVLGVAICQKERGPLEMFQQLFGGNLYSYSVRGVTYHRWFTWSSVALRFLEIILPYLILKKDRVALAIDFQKSLTVWNRDYGRRGYPDFVNAAREQFFQSMKELNRRGISTSNPNPKIPGVKKGSPSYFSNRGGGALETKNNGGSVQ